MLNYVVDFDDLCDEVADRSIDLLEQVKKKHPAFKATLFTIPNRTNDDTIAKLKAYPWLTLAPHGWHHTRGECLTWSSYEAEEKIRAAAIRGIDAPAFRAPAWLINRATYEACRDLDIVICDHEDQYLHLPFTKIYRYNNPAMRAPDTLTVHGHLTQCNTDNFIGDMVADNRLSFPTKATFLYPWQACVTVPEDPQ